LGADSITEYATSPSTSASSTPSMVTVRGAQSSGMKSTRCTLVTPSVSSVLSTATLTCPVGGALSDTVNCAVVPSSPVIRPETGVTMISRGTLG
jgi:hypothetical protein